MSQRRMTTKQVLAVNRKAEESAGLSVRRGWPVPSFLGGNLTERLDPAGEHLALYAAGADTGKGHEMVVVDDQGPGGCPRYENGARLRRTQVLLKLLGDREPYSTYLDMTQEDFDSLPPADVHFHAPSPPVRDKEDDTAGVKNGRGPEEYDEEHHKGHMGRYVETVDQHTIQCCCCGAEYTMDSIPLAQFLDELYDDGWRLAASEHLQTKGVMCEGCYASRDKERGACRDVE